MSLRPSIYAADVAGFRAMLAGDHVPLVNAVKQWYRARHVNGTAAEIEQDLGLLLRGAWAGQPESDQHVYLVAGLAHACGLDSEAAMIHWGNWKIGAYDDYFDALKPVLPAASLELCEFLRSGRAMFGTRIDTEWAYYSYLLAGEVRQLATDLSAAHARLPELDSPDCIHGFPTEFRGWIEQIESQGADLWLFAE